MTVGERIKKRREECGLSVIDLAEMLGKARSTIYRYESDEVMDMPITVLEPLANALSTTPAYLMGWTNDPINYDDEALIAELPTEIIKHFDGDIKKAYAVQKAIESDANDESDIRMVARKMKDMSIADRKRLLKLIDAMFSDDDE